MKLRALCCPRCGAPASVSSVQCRYCGAGLQIGSVDLSANPHHTSVDFTTGATPPELAAWGTADVTPQAGIGLVFRLAAGAARRLAPAKPFKDGHARVEGLALDPDASIDVGVRVIDAGKLRVGYALQARPSLGEVRVIRFARLDGVDAGEEVLLPWTATPALRPIGELNRIELLAADRLIQARVNDVLVARLEDAHYGYGAPLYGASSLGQAARVTLRRFDHGLF